MTSARTLAPARASCLSSRFLNEMHPIQSYMMRTSTPAARRSSRIGTISAVSRSCSQMKYCRWMNRCASARSSLSRRNLWAPSLKSSSDDAGKTVETFSLVIARLIGTAIVPAHSRRKRSEAPALRSQMGAISSASTRRSVSIHPWRVATTFQSRPKKM